MPVVSLNVNGHAHKVEADSETPLLWVIRDDIGLTGTKFGCGVAQCGACTVHIDGQPARSCVTPAAAVHGRKVTTIEGLQSKAAKAVQKVWVDMDVVQCGYCQSGQIMQAAALLKTKPQPSDAEIEQGMNGNLCRCMAYVRIKKAIKLAASRMQGATA